jgi:hypothetical protein
MFKNRTDHDLLRVLALVFMVAAAAAQDAPKTVAPSQAADAPDPASTPEPADPSTPSIDLTGVWQLDGARSEDLQERLQKLLERQRKERSASADRDDRGNQGPGMSGRSGMGRPGGGMGGGMTGGMGNRGGGRPSDRSGGDTGPPQAPPTSAGPGALRGLAGNLATLLISHDGPRIEVIDGSDELAVWVPDGKPVVRAAPRGAGGDSGVITDRAWWDGSVLVLETVNPRHTLTRRLQREPGSQDLFVEITVTMARTDDSATARLVYRKA